MCLTALFLKDNNKIKNKCKLAVTNITDPQTNYLDQGILGNICNLTYTNGN